MEDEDGKALVPSAAGAGAGAAGFGVGGMGSPTATGAAALEEAKAAQAKAAIALTVHLTQVRFGLPCWFIRSKRAAQSRPAAVFAAAGAGERRGPRA